MKRFVSTTRSVRALCSAAAIGGAILASHAGALAQNNVLSLESKIQQRMHIRGAAVVKLNVADVPGAAQQVVVPLAGQLVTLDLQPYSLRDPAYTCWEQRDDGLFYQVDPGPESTWRGTVLELPGSMVAGGLVKGGIFARVTIPDGREYWIEHIGGRIDGADDATHIIYTLDNLMQGDNRCGNTIMPDRPPPKPGEDDGGAAPRGATLYTAQLATDADWEYFQDYGGTTWVSQRISAVINTMNVQYERDVNITHVISQSVIRTTSADPYTTTDPATLNAQIQTAWNGMAGTRDVIQLFTGRDIDGSVIGRANAIGSICSAGNGASNCYVQSDFNGNFMSAADLSAHELGHLWDATHCTCSNPASTMNPSITSINRFTFSPNNNQTQIVTYRNGLGCLTTSGTGGPPRNDECIDGVPISTGRFGFSNIGATTDPAPVPTACGSIGDDIWYTFLAPCDGMMSIDTCNNANEEPGFDTVLAVYTGSCSSLTQVTCNDDDAGCTVSSPARRSLVTFAVTRNTLYRIRVGGFSGANGSGIIDFDLLSQDCPPVPTNDACGGAITISECSGTVAASNVGADADGFVEVTDCTAASSSAIFNDLWYRVVAPCTGNIRVSTCGSAIDTKVAIFNSCPTGPNQSIACNDDNGPGCAGLDASVDFAAAAGSDYFIQVGSYNPATTGNISISVSALACPTPANDVCAGATVISTGTRSFTNVNACSEGAMGCGSGAASVWYAFTPSTSCNYTLTTCSLTTLDTVFGIYDECSSTTPIICVDDSCGLQTTISWNATAGEDYFIRLHGFGGAFGTGQFNLAANGPANDLCANAAVASLGVNNFDNRCSAGEGANGCGSGNASVFYTFTSPVTSMLNISTCDLTTIDSVIGVYTNCAATTPIVCNDDFCGLQTRLTLPATNGTSYIIRVHGFGGSQGMGAFRIGPDNDECENPLVITNGSTTVNINGATQSGANIGCLIPFADVWMAYTATCNGTVTVDTCGAGTSFDTVLSAYNGLACPVTTVRQQACNDDSCGLQSRITFNAMVGRPYLIRLSNFSNVANGTANVTVGCVNACPCNFNGDAFVNSQDFFDFLSCFFGGGCPAGRTADYNSDGTVNSQDFFDFITCFFDPGGFGC